MNREPLLRTRECQEWRPFLWHTKDTTDNPSVEDWPVMSSAKMTPRLAQTWEVPDL